MVSKTLQKIADAECQHNYVVVHKMTKYYVDNSYTETSICKNCGNIVKEEINFDTVDKRL